MYINDYGWVIEFMNAHTGKEELYLIKTEEDIPDICLDGCPDVSIKHNGNYLRYRVGCAWINPENFNADGVIYESLNERQTLKQMLHVLPEIWPFKNLKKGKCKWCNNG